MLDTRQFGQERKYGDIVTYITYQNEQRVLVMRPVHRAGRPVAFPEKDAHLYVTPSGDPTEELLKICNFYAVAMGFEESDYYAPLTLIDIVLDRLPELIEAAPVLEVPEKAGFEYDIKLDGKTIGEGTL